MASRTALLTDQLLRSLRPGPNGERVTVCDSKVVGLWVRKGPRFTSFVAVARIRKGDGRPQKLTIGHYPQVTLVKARELAQKWLLEMKVLGNDPAEQIRQNAAAAMAAKKARHRTFAVVWNEWAAETEGQVSERTNSDRKLIQRYLSKSPLFDTPFDHLTIRAVDETLRPLMTAALPPQVDAHGQLMPPFPAPAWFPLPTVSASVALKMYGYAQAAWTHVAALDERATANPFASWRIRNRALIPEMPKRTGHLRTDRAEGQAWVTHLMALRDDENATVACTADLLTLILLWGGRRLETQRLRWTDVDLDEQQVTFRREHTKTKQAQIFPLTSWAAEILAARKKKNTSRYLPVEPDEWVFSSRRRSRAQVRAEQEAVKNRQPVPAWAQRPTYIKSLTAVLASLADQTGKRLTPHDLRRTVATDLALDVVVLQTAAAALNHAAHGDYAQTRDYVQNKVRLLRPRYEQHEDRIRKLGGLPPLHGPAPIQSLAELTPQQQWTVEAAQKMLRDVGLDGLPMTAKEP
jgi:integrase